MFVAPPGLKKLLSYDSTWLRGDILAGLTVAAYLIPQCMAYGELAGVRPVAGLWAILPAMLIYTFLGSSPQLSVGPESTTAVMTAVAIAPLAAADGHDYATLAGLLAVIVGGVYIVGYFLRLGFLANLLSKPILIGYMAGVAVIMISGQLGKVAGLSIDAETILGEIKGFLTQLPQAHVPTLVLSIVLLIFLFAIQARFPNAPGALIAVLAATAAVKIFQLDQLGIAVVGEIPSGLPTPRLPDFANEQLLALVSASVGIAVVGYSDNVLTARAFAARNNYTIDANQELLALGFSNMGAGLMQGFPISSSGSRTVIGNALGNKTQLFSLVAMGAVVLVLLFLRPVLASFPTAALGTLVIFAATRLIEIDEFKRLQRFRNSEFALAMITMVSVLATDLLIGIAIAIILSVVELFGRVARPHDAVLGKIKGLAGWHDIDDWEHSVTISGLLMYRYDAPLCFANAENFKQRAKAAIEAEKATVTWFILNAEAIAEIDITASDMLETFIHELNSQQITFAMMEVKQDLYAQLQRSGMLQKIGEDHIFPTIETAVQAFQADSQSTPETSLQSIEGL